MKWFFFPIVVLFFCFCWSLSFPITFQSWSKVGHLPLRRWSVAAALLACHNSKNVFQTSTFFSLRFCLIFYIALIFKLFAWKETDKGFDRFEFLERFCELLIRFLFFPFKMLYAKVRKKVVPRWEWVKQCFDRYLLWRTVENSPYHYFILFKRARYYFRVFFTALVIF